MDTLKTIWEDFSDRFKSPFIVSFLISWSLWNWRLLYSITNFDCNLNLDYKLNYINDYLHEHACILSVIPLITSIIAALIFYLFKSLFLILDSFYENRLRIWSIKFIGAEKMIPLSDLEKYIREIDIYKKTFEEKNQLYSTSQSELNQVKINLTEKERELKTYQETNPPFRSCTPEVTTIGICNADKQPSFLY